MPSRGYILFVLLLILFGWLGWYSSSGHLDGLWGGKTVERQAEAPEAPTQVATNDTVPSATLTARDAESRNDDDAALRAELAAWGERVRARREARRKEREAQRIAEERRAEEERRAADAAERERQEAEEREARRIAEERDAFLAQLEADREAERRAAAAAQARREAEEREARRLANERARKEAEDREARRIAEERNAFLAQLEADREAERRKAAEAQARRDRDREEANRRRAEAEAEQRRAKEAEARARAERTAKLAVWARAVRQRRAERAAARLRREEDARKVREATERRRQAKLEEWAEIEKRRLAKIERERALSAAQAQCLKRVRTLAERGTIEFPSESAQIDETSFETLNQIVEAATGCDGVSLTISGHTDSRGSDAFNQTLSEARAQAVVDYLVSRGVPTSRLKAVGFGPRQPVAPNNSFANMAKNRRIEFSTD